MQKNYPFFTLPEPGNRVSKNKERVRHIARKASQRFLIAFCLLATHFGYSQLATEYFEGGIPASWAVESNLTPTNNWAATPTGGYLATGGATVNPALNNTVGTTAEYFMITPQFLTPSNGEIRFFTKQGSATNMGATFEIRISTANQPDLGSFNVTLESWTEDELNSTVTYEEKVVPIPTIPAGIPVYIAFVAITNQTGTSATSGDTWFVDNARVISGCELVTDPTIIATTNSATISWTHPSASNFEIAVLASGASPGAMGDPVGGTSHTENDLEPSTTYDVYIKTVCDPETSSAWAGPFPFTTSTIGLTCQTGIVIPSDTATAPYVLSDNLANYYTDVEYTPYTTDGSNCFPAGTSNQLEGNHIFLNYTPTATGLINISLVVDDSGTNNCWNSSSSVMVFDNCADVGETCLAAAMTQWGQTSVAINEFYVEAGNTYVIVISSPYTHSEEQNASVCFTFTVAGSACPSPSPSGTTYSDLTQTEGNFSWNNAGNLMDTWQYIALPVDAGAPTGSETLTTTNTNLNNNVPGLTAATTYNLYVRSVCGGNPGDWAAPFTFTTPCDAFTPPYYTGFDDTTVPCWSQLNLNNDTNEFNFGSDANGEPVAKLRTMNADQVTNDMLISPQFHLDGTTQKRLRFKFQAYGGGPTFDTGGTSTFEIRMSTTGVGANNFTTVVLPLEGYVTNYNYIEKTVVLPNIAGDIHLAWVLPPGSTQEATQFYIDDVYVEDLPACSEPSYPAVTAGSITPTTAEVSWTNGYNNTQWELVAQPLNTGTPTTPGLIVDENPYMLTDLDPSTRYEFYIRAYCSETEQSIWVGPINFNTECIEQPTPYFESFDDADVNTKKFCWTTNNQNADVAEWSITGTEAQIWPQGTWFEPLTSFDDWLISVPVNAVGAKRVRFKYRVTTSPFYPTPRGNFEVLMSSTPDFSTYTVLIPTHDFTNIGYLEDSAIFTGTGTTYFAFRVPPTMSNPWDSGVVMVDDFVVEDAPPCPDPTHLTASNFTPNTATLGWTAGYTETQWQIVVQEAGLGIPTGSGETVNTTPVYNADGLAQNTLHEFYVKAICTDDENSAWVGPFAFMTTCDPLPTPFQETFDSTSATESCWRIINGNTDANSWNLSQPANPIFGDQMASLFTGSNGNNNDWLITPTLSAHAGQRLRFYYKVLDSFFEEDLKVMLSINGIETTQFTTLLYQNNLSTTTDANGTVEGSNTITVASVQGIQIGDIMYIPNFPFPYGSTVTNIAGNVITLSENATMTLPGELHVEFKHETINNTEVREMVINLDAVATPSNINIAFHTPFYPPNPWNYRGQYTFIDNVIIEDIPACPEVINVTTSNLLDTTVQVDWETTGTEGSWEISVQPFGTPAPVGNTLPEYLHTTNSHPYVITDLTPATQYEYYVRAICGDDSQSVWVGPFEFITRCDFTNVCQYTITVTNGTTGQVTQHVNLMQNGVVVQEINFPGWDQESLEYQVFLCSGVAFDLYWAGLGSGEQYYEAQLTIKDELDNIVWTSPLGLGTVNTTIYSGFASCGTITCPAPTNLVVSNQGELSWTPGGSETQWEVFVQPLENGTLPQSGTIVDTPNYTPVASDFVDASAGTYEYFVRAVCSDADQSFWSGPKVFIRNDEPATAVRLTPNTGTACEDSGADASFRGATPSVTPTACAGTNGGDIWYDFVATSKVHIIELSDFGPGSYWNSSFEGPWPKIMMSLYEEQSPGVLVEKGCSENNSFVTMYSTELIVGTTYKIRLKLDSATPNDKKFNICITTPDACDMDAFNYDFEKLPLQAVSGITSIIDAVVVPGWRVNTTWGAMFFLEASNMNITPYSGGQSIQLVHDDQSEWDESSPDIKGLYKDFDTSEITAMDYSFASATRMTSGEGTTVQLFAGPPSGPFALVTEDNANSSVWELIEGTYDIPSGQNTTRFIFRTKEYAIGHILDAANFTSNVEITIDTANTTLDCATTSMQFAANGVGQWEAEATNPAVTVIANPNSSATDVSGFTAAGNYVFHWKSRYCDKTITIVKQASDEITQVVSPLIYCQNDTASPLTATVPAGSTVMWYTQAVGGTGSTTAPTPSTATVGSDQVFYAASADANGCEGPRAEIVVQINALTAPNVTFSYAGTCTNAATNPLPILADGFTAGGVFSSTTLTVDAVTGAVSLATATVGSHEITYTIGANPATCTDAGTFTATIVLSEGITPITDFTYNPTYCAAAANDFPATADGFTAGGTFSATAGLSIDATTGEINPSQSTSGTYAVTYTVEADAATCNLGGSSTFQVTIAPELAFGIAAVCQDSMLTLEIVDANFTTGEITWMQGTTTVGTGDTFNVDEYLAQNPSLVLPVSFTATTGSGDCNATQDFTVGTNPCRVIPRGISPNNDQLNDTFDLTGYGVKEIIIFNRYGTKVFSYSGNYANQWKGQSDSGNDLPDGTYFYSIHTNDGANKTGWVYINRQH